MLTGFSAQSYASDQEGLQIELTPYLWAMGIDGSLKATTGTAGTPIKDEANFDTSFSDIADNMDAGGSMLGVLSYNRFVLYANYDFLDVSNDEKRGANKVEGEIDSDITTFAGGYRFDTFGEHSTLDVLIGSRTLALDSQIKVTGPSITTRSVSNNSDITDSIVMLRPSFQLSEKWRFNPTLAYGISGDSDEMYELSPQVQYDFSKSFALRFGYKTIHYTLEDGQPNVPGYRELDVDLAGFMVGVGWTFPAQKEHVAAAAPAPVVAKKPAPVVASAAPKDTDGDGVPDTIDACPDTPKGTKVGPKGCTCDISIQLQYKFDSAELTDADKKQLDTTAANLVRLHWVSGTAVGHADNVGAADYNIKLSQRRAQAAVDYLATKGVDASRIKVSGVGSADPIADNSTAEGRAQNRRVVLSRTDCENPN